MAAGGKAARVEADLADDAAGGERANARDGGQLLGGNPKGFEASLDLLVVDPADGFIDGVDLLQVEIEQEAMMLGDPPAQGIA